MSRNTQKDKHCTGKVMIVMEIFETTEVVNVIKEVKLKCMIEEEKVG